MEISDSGDDAVLVTLAAAAGDEASDLVLCWWRALVQAAPRLIAAQPAYTRVQVVFASDVDIDEVRDFLGALVPLPLSAPVRVVEVPVRYGGDDGPDLVDVSCHSGLTVADVVCRHTAARYRVAFCGFLPNFPQGLA